VLARLIQVTGLMAGLHVAARARWRPSWPVQPRLRWPLADPGAGTQNHEPTRDSLSREP